MRLSYLHEEQFNRSFEIDPYTNPIPILKDFHNSRLENPIPPIEAPKDLPNTNTPLPKELGGPNPNNIILHTILNAMDLVVGDRFAPAYNLINRAKTDPNINKSEVISKVSNLIYDALQDYKYWEFNAKLEELINQSKYREIIKGAISDKWENKLKFLSAFCYPTAKYLVDMYIS